MIVFYYVAFCIRLWLCMITIPWKSDIWRWSENSLNVLEHWSLTYRLCIHTTNEQLVNNLCKDIVKLNYLLHGYVRLKIQSNVTVFFFIYIIMWSSTVHFVVRISSVLIHSRMNIRSQINGNMPKTKTTDENCDNGWMIFELWLDFLFMNFRSNFLLNDKYTLIKYSRRLQLD